MIRRPPRSTLSSSSAASDVYKRQRIALGLAASSSLDKPGAAPAQWLAPVGVVMDSSLVKAVGFVHLRVHSAFSLRQGALSIETLAKLAKADSMPALAITDTNNLFGALEFSEKLAKSGVQPIIGAQITVDFGDAPPSASRLAETRVARAPMIGCTP